MNTFTPQLSQQDLAEMIDRERLAFEVNFPIYGWQKPSCKMARDVLEATFNSEIRLAPGSLTDFGLKPGMVPHNPDGLTAEQITDGGKWRSLVEGEAEGQIPEGCEWWNGSFWDDCSGSIFQKDWTYRLPVNTPFSKPSRTEPPAEQSLVTQQAGQSLTPRTEGIWDLLNITWSDKTCQEQFFAAKEGARIGIEDLETELTAALAQRDEANRLLGEATESMENTLTLLQHADFSHGVADSSGYDEGNYIAEKYEKRIQEKITQITNHLKP